MQGAWEPKEGKAAARPSASRKRGITSTSSGGRGRTAASAAGVGSTVQQRLLDLAACALCNLGTRGSVSATMASDIRHLVLCRM